jgi:hypothetical protein
MNTSPIQTRRRFLQGLGVTLALPALERFTSLHATSAGTTGPAQTVSGTPLRMAFLYVPNGVVVDQWTPRGTGADYQLNETLKPLAEFKSEFQVFSGFEHKNGWAGPDGAGDHARAGATILTGARPRKTAGSDIRAGISVDQLAAQKAGHLTRFPSLELSCDGVRKSGDCDSGYSCAYQYNISWRSETHPVAPESNPRLVFERLFGAGTAAERERAYRERLTRQKSVLDYVREDTDQLERSLGGNDRRKLDQYLTGVRELEARIQRTEQLGAIPELAREAPDGIPGGYPDHIRLLMDMLLLAFQTDATRIATFLLAHDGSNRSFKPIGVPEGHHDLSHHQGDRAKMDKIAVIDRFYVEQFAYFLGRLRELRDADGHPMLDNSMIMYCSGLSDANRHSHDNLPVIVAGRAGGRLHPGRHVQLPDKVPMNNLFVGLLDAYGTPVERFGDSTGIWKDV